MDFLINALEDRCRSNSLFRVETRQYVYPVIAGSPGIGKSRLLHELPHLLDCVRPRFPAQLANIPIASVQVTFNCETPFNPSADNSPEWMLVSRILYSLGVATSFGYVCYYPQSYQYSLGDSVLVHIGISRTYLRCYASPVCR